MCRFLRSESGGWAFIGEGRADGLEGSFHAKTHDTFLCLRGTMKVWQDDQCRILGPGDFASVPPVGALHLYRTTPSDDASSRRSSRGVYTRFNRSRRRTSL